MLRFMLIFIKCIILVIENTKTKHKTYSVNGEVDTNENFNKPFKLQKMVFVIT